MRYLKTTCERAASRSRAHGATALGVSSSCVRVIRENRHDEGYLQDHVSEREDLCR